MPSITKRIKDKYSMNDLTGIQVQDPAIGGTLTLSNNQWVVSKGLKVPVVTEDLTDNNVLFFRSDLYANS
ncbi:hypothetical protein F4V43_02615 [Paenibacillus spiritus]|uniref:Uncharacterized protein n=1 Tax=Paenibacillus spiritus TaxID=2496557 RepID=A0A5J5GI89_9BACL|nr:hypothetical protein [Paenibacillus spiritus]KAA9007398.1 hypothetical protein F4V43_02615 [Paenibacillus spiritus]